MTQAKRGVRKPEDSKVEMTEVVMPQFANSIGTVFGGQVVSWIDICAAVSAQRFSQGSAVTASIDSVHFIEPIRQGQVVVLKGQVNAAFKTSMEIGVRVVAETPATGETRHAVSAYCTFVALDKNGKPKPLPKLLVETEKEKRREREAVQRREIRLKSRQQKQRQFEEEESV